MVIKRPAAAEAAQLVADLLRGDPPVRAEAAKARLLVLGARAVPHLADALASAGEADVPTLLGVLELLPATRQVLPALDTAAARHDTASAAAAVWASWLAAEDRALATLAFDRLAALALSESSPMAARRIAARAIGGLGDQASAGLLARVPAAFATAEPEAVEGEVTHPATELADDSAAALRQHVAARGGLLPLSELHRALERARARQQAAAGQAEAREWLAARGAVHQALANRGSTVALYDLRELFERLEDPPPLGALAALRALGDASCLDAVASAWSRASDDWTRDQLRAAAVEICGRHRVTSRHAAMKRLAARAQALAAALARRPRVSA